jgi:hypothetical protein
VSDDCGLLVIPVAVIDRGSANAVNQSIRPT